MKKLLLALALAATPAMAAEPCPQVDPKKVDADGVPLCPDVVKEKSAFSVFTCAIFAQKTWHPPTKAEIAAGKAMLGAFKAKDYKQLMVSADAMRAQVCRVIDGEDKYLLVYAKPKVRDYNGPNFILRDAAKVSKLVINAPHVTSDYSSQPPMGVQQSHALALIQNGYRRGLPSPNGKPNEARRTDYSKTQDTLGWHLTQELGKLFQPVVLHVHGMSDGSKVLYRPIKGPLAKPFEAAVKKFTSITVFEGFNAWYAIDPPVSTGGSAWYVKTELPVRIYKNQPKILANIFNEWELQPWAWNEVPTPSAEPEPPVPEEPEEELPDEEPEDDPKGECEHEEEPEGEPTPSPTPPAKPAFQPPKQKPVVGTKTLTCVAVKFKDGTMGATDAQCKEMAENMAKWHTRISRGKLDFVPRVVGLNLPQTPTVRTKKEEAPVVAIIKQKVKSDYYIFPMLYRAKGNHGGHRVAYVVQMTGWLIAHELGHTMGINHAGKYDLKPDGSLGAYHQYGDNGNSYMAGGMGSKYINASQHYHVGWLAPEEVAVKTKREPETYELVAMDDLKSKGLRTVVLDSGGERPLFLSYPVMCQKACVGMHLASGGASALLRTVTGEYKDPATGLSVKVLGGSGTKVQVEVKFD